MFCTIVKVVLNGMKTILNIHLLKLQTLEIHFTVSHFSWIIKSNFDNNNELKRKLHELNITICKM